MRIVIDAGHGPDTPGKRSPDGTLREFEFNSAVARYMRERLLQFQGVEVRFAHAEDGSRDVPLQERTNMANAWNANLFVSVHANAYGTGWNDVGGIETYVYTTRPPEAVRLANLVQSRLIAATGLRNRGVKEANFHVLRETNMTAILVECGFMTNRQEAELLKSDAYRQTCAQAIVEGIQQAYQLEMRQEQTPPPAKLTSFPDVPAGHWAESDIAAVEQAGIMEGLPDGNFRPNSPVTRAELATVAARLYRLIQGSEPG